MQATISRLLALTLALHQVAGHAIARSATISSASTSATPVKTTGKRGLAYNNPELTNYFSLSGQNSEVSWAYNWYYEETNPSELNPDVEYIPLLYNNNADLLAAWPAAAQAAIDNGSTALFSFNEPDYEYDGSGSNYMDIDTAVATWKEYMEPFAGKAQLVAPAVTNVGPPSGLTWLGWFLGNCTDCTIDAVNIHWYSNKWAGASYLESQVKAARAIAGGRSIIISEFGLDDSDGTYTDADLLAFLETALPWLDAQEDVTRYAYFYDAPGYLINTDGTGLSDSGVLYNNYTTSSSSTSSSIVGSTTTSTTSSSTIKATTTSKTSSTSTTSTISTSTTPAGKSPSTVNSASTISSRSSSSIISTTSTTTSRSSSSSVSTHASSSTSKLSSSSASSSAANSTPTLEILSAYFATENITANARTSFLQSGSMVINTENLATVAGGDPWYGVLKTLTVLYTLGNETLVFVAEEQSGTYTITPSSSTSSSAVVVPDIAVPTGSPIEIVAVVWGDGSISTKSVWTALYSQATTDWGFQISDTLFGIDTMWGHEKSAVIWYRLNGVLLSLVGEEDSWVKFVV